MFEFISPDGSIELSFSIANDTTSDDLDECNSNSYNSNTRLIFLVIYSLVFVLSVFGNSLILCVIMRRRRMRTVTNYFIANITITNLIYTACEPLNILIEMYSCWIFLSFTCPFLTIVSTLSINVNAFTMIAASLDRLIVIKYPFKTKLTKNQAINVIALIWILGVCVSFPWAFLLRPAKSIADYVNEFVPSYISQILELNATLANLKFESSLIPDYYFNTPSSNESTTSYGSYLSGIESFEISNGYKQRFPTCELLNVNYLRYYTMILIWIQFVIPLLILVATYLIIAYYIYVPQSDMITNRCRNGLLDRKKKKSIRMLVLTIVGFNVCWFPIHTIVLLDQIRPSYLSDMLGDLNDFRWPITHLLAFTHFCHNPFINGLLNKKLKEEITSLFRYMYIAAKQFVLKIACCLVRRNERGRLILFYKGPPGGGGGGVGHFDLDANNQQQMIEEPHSSEILKKGHLKVGGVSVGGGGGNGGIMQANYMCIENIGEVADHRVVELDNYRSNQTSHGGGGGGTRRKLFWTRSHSSSGVGGRRSKKRGDSKSFQDSMQHQHSMAESYEREIFLTNNNNEMSHNHNISSQRHRSLKFRTAVPHLNSSLFKSYHSNNNNNDVSSLNAIISSSSSTSKSTSSNNNNNHGCMGGGGGADLKRLKYMCSSHKLMSSLSQRVSSLESLCKMNNNNKTSHRREAISRREKSSFNSGSGGGGSGKKVVFRFAPSPITTAATTATKNDDLKIKEVFYSTYENEKPLFLSSREQHVTPSGCVGSLLEFSSQSKPTTSSTSTTTSNTSGGAPLFVTATVANVKRFNNKLLSSYDLLLSTRSTRSFSIPPAKSQQQQEYS